jgi:hypothetical protein
MTKYKIISRIMRDRGLRYESIDKVRAAAKLESVRKSVDPDARLVQITAER